MAGMREMKRKKGNADVGDNLFLIFFLLAATSFFLSSILLLRIKAKVSRLRRLYCIWTRDWSGGGFSCLHLVFDQSNLSEII